MTRLRLVLALSVLAITPLAAAASCSSTPSIDPSDFDSSCTVDSDCVVVDLPQDCCFGCGNDAINKKDLAKYEAERQAVIDDCGHTSCPAYDCAPPEAVCHSGHCSVCRAVVGSCLGDAGADAP